MCTFNPLAKQKGVALALVLFFVLILVMSGSVFFLASQTETKSSSSYTRRIESLSIAESAAERALWRLSKEDWSPECADVMPQYREAWNRNFGGDASFIKITDGQYMRVSYPETVFRGSDYANVRFIATGITGREEDGKIIPICTKQIEVIVRVERDVDDEMPKVFDYAYFLNNWGWWYYAGGEKCDGSMRSNGRFDLKKIYGSMSPWSPSEAISIDGTVEGHFDIDNHDYLPDGLAGLKRNSDNKYSYEKSDLAKENIPNLQDMDYYKKIAQGWNPEKKIYDRSPGKINIGDRVFTEDGVFDGSKGEGNRKNLILIGTPEAPVEIHDAVVVEGNLVIKGYVKTYGVSADKPFASIYVGRNVYIAGDIQYVNGPDWASYPQWQQTGGTDYTNPLNNTLNINNNDDGLPGKPMMDNWVGSNSTKNLLSVAASGGLVYGNYSSSSWYSESYLFKMGNEDVGADGIPDTNQWIDGHWTDPTEGDGIFQAETEDLDGDGKFRNTDYGWKDVTTTGGNSKSSAPLESFEGLRKGGKETGQLWDPMEKREINHYYETATNMISTIDGVYYTQHFLAGRVANSPKFRGSLVSKDEAIVYSGKLGLIQDTRYHSNYREDPNFPIHLFPPGSIEDLETERLGTLQKVVSWREQ